MKNTSKKLTALILALVLTLSLALAAPAASAATVELSDTAARGDVSNPMPLSFGTSHTVTLTEEGQTYYYKVTLNASGVVSLSAGFTGDLYKSFSFSFLNLTDNARIESKILYSSNMIQQHSFYLRRGVYLFAVSKNFYGGSYTVTSKLNFYTANETFPESQTYNDNNDVAERASVIKANQIITGQLGYEADQNDWYKLTLAENSRLILNRSVDEEVKLFIYSAADLNKALASNEYYAQSKIDIYLKKGVYYIKAGKFTGLYSFTPQISDRVTKLNASATTNSVTLRWEKDPKASGYQIFRDTGKGWKHLKFCASANNSYTVASLARGKSYRFAVRPYYDKDGVRYYGNRVAVTAKTPYSVKTPALPTLKNTKSGVRITITRVPGAAKYRIFRKENRRGWKKIADTTNNTFTDKSAVNGRSYTYTVRCITSDGKAYTSGFNRTGRTIKCKR